MGCSEVPTDDAGLEVLVEYCTNAQINAQQKAHEIKAILKRFCTDPEQDSDNEECDKHLGGQVQEFLMQVSVSNVTRLEGKELYDMLEGCYAADACRAAEGKLQDRLDYLKDVIEEEGEINCRIRDCDVAQEDFSRIMAARHKRKCQENLDDYDEDGGDTMEMMEEEEFEVVGEVCIHLATLGHARMSREETDYICEELLQRPDLKEDCAMIFNKTNPEGVKNKKIYQVLYDKCSAECAQFSYEKAPPCNIEEQMQFRAMQLREWYLDALCEDDKLEDCAEFEKVQHAADVAKNLTEVVVGEGGEGVGPGGDIGCRPAPLCRHREQGQDLQDGILYCVPDTCKLNGPGDVVRIIICCMVL